MLELTSTFPTVCSFFPFSDQSFKKSRIEKPDLRRNFQIFFSFVYRVNMHKQYSRMETGERRAGCTAEIQTKHTRGKKGALKWKKGIKGREKKLNGRLSFLQEKHSCHIIHPPFCISSDHSVCPSSHLDFFPPPNVSSFCPCFCFPFCHLSPSVSSAYQSLFISFPLLSSSIQYFLSYFSFFPVLPFFPSCTHLKGALWCFLVNIVVFTFSVCVSLRFDKHA